METKKQGREATIRASVSFSAETYRLIEEIARQKKVSVAWVVREATEEYIANKWPLLARGEAGPYRS